jgi:predicted TIM-barrel fold metal-dependent hydrolase
MLTLDAQVHAYERDHPGRPWVGALHGPPEVTGEDMVAAMDAAGVDGALLVSAFSQYRYDASYAQSVHAAHPKRFRLVKPVDPADPGVAETIADWARAEGAVGVRLLILGQDISRDPADAGLNRVLAAAGRCGLPVNIVGFGRLDQVAGLAARNPDTQLLIDHLGLRPPVHPPAPADVFADLPRVLALAAHANVAVKLTGACPLSREPYPFTDLWEPLGRIFDAFGVERCLWGSDWTRALDFCSYREAADAFRLSERLSPAELATVMGGALQRIYRWSFADA